MANKVYKPPTVQIEPGKWYRLDNPEATECCDCGLIHHTDYRLYKGRLLFRTRTDVRATRARRKERGIKIVRETMPAPQCGAPSTRQKPGR